MAWITPKTDWLATDFYNFDDINRVENNTVEVRSYLVSIGYNIPSIVTITNRVGKSYDLVSSINRLEANLDTIKNNFVTPPNWQNSVFWDSGTKFTEIHANRWESNVQLLYTYAQLTFQAYRYSGTFNAGQEVLG
jgi:hypothetical protein